jgi:hypothetical protein
MIGVTIGTGGFREMAEEAARRFTQYTGLPCTILGDEHLSRMDLPYPHHLKYHIFDLVDSQDVFYFDADLWFLREWSPEKLQEQAPPNALVAVKDMQKAGHIWKDADKFDLDVTQYFNSGFMIMNRQFHKQLLTLAKHLYDKVIASEKHIGKSFFKDQTSLNMAAQMLELPVHYVPRQYNWYHSAGEWWWRGLPLIGAHKISRDNRKKTNDPLEDFRLFLQNPPEVRYNIDQEDYTKLSGKWTYTREGHNMQLIQLLPDGTVQGSGLLEQWWVPVSHKQTNLKEIWVLGHLKYKLDEYLTFQVREAEPGVWVGRWNHFEEMPITMRHMEQG